MSRYGEIRNGCLALFHSEKKKAEEQLGCPQVYREDINSSPSPQTLTYTLFLDNIIYFHHFTCHLYSTCIVGL